MPKTAHTLWRSLARIIAPPTPLPTLHATLAAVRVLVLAGGFATRLWPLTERRPKPLLPLAGRPMLSYLLGRLPPRARITISTNAAFQSDFEAFITAENLQANLRREQAQGETEKLGALGAVAAFLAEYPEPEPLLVLAGDNLFSPDAPLEDIFAAMENSPETALLAREVATTQQASQFGVMTCDKAGRVTAFAEKPAQPKSRLVATGVFYFSADALPFLADFAAQHPDDLGAVIPHLLAKKLPIRAQTMRQGEWFDVGNFEAYLGATRHLVGEGTLDLGCGQNVGNELSGTVVLGKGACVLHSRLHNAVVEPGATVSRATVFSSVVGANAVAHNVDLAGTVLRSGSVYVVPE